MTDIISKKNVTQLQKLVIDGLEDVKAHDIKVFNTESLSPLFERVIIASGTSNRQTKALASSVRDVVREAGFGKPRIEGEENGEWIIVDCGAVVAHIMQPAIREYYHLEEIWGDKPVRFKHGEDKMSELVKEKAPKPGKTSKSAKSTKGDAEVKSGRGAKAPLKKAKTAKTAKTEKATSSSDKRGPGTDSTKSANKARKSPLKNSVKPSTTKSASKSDKAKQKSSPSVSETLSSARTKSATSKAKGTASAPAVKTRNSPPRA